MDYACEDFSEIARRLREIEDGRSVEWGIRHDDGTLKCWCVKLGDFLGAAAPFSEFPPTRFSSKEEAENALKVAQNVVHTMSFTVRELPPLPASDTA